MSVIYEPSGKAREYCERSVNLYHGCDHGCAYCYAPSATYKTREAFAEVRHRPGIIDAIKKEASAHAGLEVLLCFTCDPYSSFAAGTGITRQAIEALHSGGVNVAILTKGGKRSIRDFDLLTASDKYGATLTFLSDADSQEWEPGAALPAERIAALKQAKAHGITTWASFEPVIDPEQTLKLIEMTRGIIDIYKVGKWNHDKRAKEIDWKSFALRVKVLLDKSGEKYMIKKDLAAYLEAAA